MEDEREQQQATPSAASEEAAASGERAFLLTPLPAPTPPSGASEAPAPETAPMSTPMPVLDEIPADEDEEETTRMSRSPLPSQSQTSPNETLPAEVSGPSALAAQPAAEDVAGEAPRMEGAIEESSIVNSVPSPMLSAPPSPISGPDSATLADVPSPRPRPQHQHLRPPLGAWQKPPQAPPSPAPPLGQPGQQQQQQQQAPNHIPIMASSSWGASTIRVDTTIHMNATTAAGFSYLFWWISGLFIYFNERRNRYVRFHAMQSILLTGVLTVAAVTTYAIVSICDIIAASAHAPVLAVFGTVLAWLLPIAIIFVWLAFMIAAWAGYYWHLPILGRYAERYAAPPYEPPIPPAY